MAGLPLWELCQCLLKQCLCVLPLCVDVVTCMALDKAGAGEHLITGSRDTTSVIWKFSQNVGVSAWLTHSLSDHSSAKAFTFSSWLQGFMDTPLVTLYGHDSEVLCVDISTELDMAVSGAKVPHCLHIHTLLTVTKSVHYMHVC